jgi:hypothetical protein
MNKLDQKKVAESGFKVETIPTMQTAVYVMCGGGFLGKFAAEQPGQFYIDSRVGKLPFPKKEIIQAVKTLATLATAHGLNAKHLPEMPRFHNMGIF